MIPELKKKSSLSYFQPINRKPNYLLTASPRVGKFLGDLKVLTTAFLWKIQDQDCFCMAMGIIVVLVSLQIVQFTWSK